MDGKKFNSVLGLDIAEDFIKIVELEQAQEGIKLNSFGSAHTPPNSIKEGIITNPDVIGKSIKKLLLANKAETEKAIISIRSPYALLRLSRLPFMSKKEAKIALHKEISQYVVFKGKGPVFDMHIVEEITEANIRKMSVLFAVATQELCNSYLKTAEYAELKVISVDISSLAILRSLIRTNLKVSGIEATMLVIINREGIDICIFKGERMRFCHTVKLDANQMNVDIDGFTSKVVSALKLVLNFYQAKYTGGEPISKMVLACDSYSCLPLKEKLKLNFEAIPIEIGEPVGNMVMNKDKDLRLKIRELPYFACAIGTALQAGSLSGYPVRFNLIPKEKVEKVELTKLVGFVNMILGAVLGFFLIFATASFISNKSIQQNIYELEQKLQRPDPLFSKVDSMFKQRQEIDRLIEKRVALLKKISSSNIPFERIFANIMAKVPEGLWLKGIANDESGVRINGRTSSEQLIFKFIGSLNDSLYFSSINLVSSQNIEIKDEEKIEFIIDCKLKR